MVSNLYPLKFKSIFKKTPWGGSRLGSFFGKDVPADGGIGESWEITDRDGDNSIIANGVYKDMRLRQLLDGPGMNDVLGHEYKRERSENRFPILVKLIDTADRLSIQVHPDDAYVRAHEVTGESGKMEAWYIIHTEPGAWIIRGLRPGMTRKHLESSLGNGNLENCLNLLSVRPGDVIFIPPGIVHTIGPGIILLEVQQNSNVTYRLYDWGRPRELHVQKALDVIDFASSTRHKQDKMQPILLSPPPRKRELLLKCEKFVLESLELDVQCDIDDMRTFHILTVIEGLSKIAYGRSEAVEVSAGESVLIPAALQGYKLYPHGRCKIIKSSPSF
ncbi:MAG: type I phosphomannose isomerase catalytic subunit [Planctomycetota bacterium]